MNTLTTRFDQYVNSIFNHLVEEDNGVAASNASNIAASNINPEIVKSYKDSVLVPMANKQAVDPVKMQEAIKAGIIEDGGNNTYNVTDAALVHVNQDPELQGKFLPAQQAKADAARQLAAQPAPAAPTQQNSPQQPQNPTTSKTTSKPSTNQAGVVSNVYKMQ